MTAVPYRKTLARRRFSATHVALAVGALAVSLSGPAQASSSDGVKPGTGGAPSDSTAGVGGNGGGQGGSANQYGAKNPSVNGKGGDGISGSGGIAAGGAVGTTISTNLTLSSTATGGNGAAGRVGQPDPGPFHGMSGGGGGAGAFVSGSRQVTVGSGVQVSGGAGGNGADGRPGCSSCNKGAGGGGGDGIVMSGGGTLTNVGVIRGGAGGKGVTGVQTRSSGGGGGGHGVEGANLTINNAGTISGGAGGVGGSTADNGESGAAIHWTGGTNALRVQSGSVLNGALWVGSGATATISADVAGVSLSNWLLLDGSARIDTATQSLTYSGPITGAGSLTKASSGILTLSGNNTFSGGLTIQAGEVRGQVSSLGTGAIRDDGTLHINQPVNATLNQALTGTGTLIKEGAAQLTLNGNAQLSGAFQINGGTLAIGSGGTLTAGAVQLNGAGSSLDLSASTRTATASKLSGVAGSTIRTGAGAFAVGDATDQRFDGTVSGVGGVTKQGTGSLTLTGNNTNTGRTTVSAGTLIGSSTSFGSGAIVDNASLILNQASTGTLANAVSGSGSVTKQGAGTLTMSGANSYAGGTTISEGTVIGSATSFGSGAIVDNASLILNQASDGTLANAISGSGTVAKQGSGTLTMGDANTYTGGTTVSAGTLVGSASSFGSGAIANNAALIVNQTTDGTLANAVSGSGTVAKQGAGTLTMGDANTYTGGTTISAGTVVGSSTSFGSGAIADNASLVLNQASVGTLANTISGSGTVTKQGAGTLTMGDTNTYTGGTTIGAGTVVGSASSFGSGAIANNAALILNQTTDGALANAVSGSGTVAKQGSGTLTMSDANTYTGGTTISAGTLVGSATSFGSGAIANNAALLLNQVSDGTLANVVSGSGAVTKQGAGTLTLGDANTYTGGTTVSAGTVVGSASSFGSGAIVDNAALILNQASDGTLSNPISGTGSVAKQGVGTLTLGDANTYAGGTTIGAGTVIGSASSFGSGAIRNDAALVLDQASDAALSNVISGSGGITKRGSGVLTMTGDNSYGGGTTIAAGTLAGSATSFGTGAIRNDAALIVDQATDATLANVISGNGGLTKRGTGTLTMSGANSYAGGTTVSAGTLAGSATSFGTGAIRNDATLVLDQADDATLSNAISGSGAVTKQGAGTLTLGGANTYAGGTTIAAGTLVGSVDSFGTGAIVDNGVLRLAQATDAALANTVSGSGRVEKTGAGQLSLSQALTNTGGLAVLDGRVAAVDQQFLGSGTVSVNGPGQIALNLSAETQLRHIDGDGLVAVDLADMQRRLTMSEVPAGMSNFAGTLALSNGSLALSGAGAESLSAGTLQLNAGGRLLADAGTGSIGALKMNDGSIRFTPSTPDDASTLHPLQINRTLELSGTGTVQVDMDLHGSKAAASMGSLLEQDDGVAQLLARTGPGGQVIGDAAGFRLTGGDGQAVGDSTDGEVVQNGQRVATTTTRYGLSAGTGHDGLYLNSRLLGISVLADRELMLTPSNGATGAARDLSVPIGGAGSVAIDAGDHGTISLSSQDNVYAGGTRIVSGTLALTGGSLPDGNVVRFDGAGTGLDLAAAGRPQQLGGLDGTAPSSAVQLGAQTLTLAPAGDHAFAGAITGTGALVKTGAGTQTLTGTNAYSGGTTISGGTLAGRADSFGSGAIRNDATLVVDQAADGALHNDLSGSGTVVKRGDGALTLSGANTSSGPLRIEAGTLRADVDRLGTGAIVNNAMLELDVPHAALLDGRLNGSGQLVKSGPGDLTLEGAQSIGQLSVRTGGLIVGAAGDGSALLHGSVDVASGARLQGNGTIDGSAHLSKDATLQLKSASPALRIQGDLQLDPGARVVASVDASSRQPALAVGGKMTVQGALLHVDAAKGDWAPDTRVDLLHGGQVDGRFAAVDTNLAFLTPTLEYGAQDVSLAMKRNDTAIGDLAQTPNQQQVADALSPQEDKAPAAGLVVKLPREDVAPSLEALAGSSKASAVAAPALAAAQQRLALGRHLREAMTLRNEFDDGSALWATAFQQRSALAAEQVATMHGDLHGGLVGIDLLRRQDVRLGVAIGGDRQTLSTGDLDHADVRSALFSLYGAANWQVFSLRGALSYAQSRIHTGREVVVGQYRASLSADERARHAEGFVEVGLPGHLPFGHVEPFFQVGRYATRTSGFTEHGYNATALNGTGAHDTRTFGMAGLHWSTETQYALGAGWSLQGTAAIQHVGGPATVSRRVSLAGTDSFVTSAASGAGTGVLADLGLTVTPRPRMSLSVHLEHGETGASRDNGWRVQGSWQF